MNYVRSIPKSALRSRFARDIPPFFPRRGSQTCQIRGEAWRTLQVSRRAADGGKTRTHPAPLIRHTCTSDLKSDYPRGASGPIGIPAEGDTSQASGRAERPSQRREQDQGLVRSLEGVRAPPLLDLDASCAARSPPLSLLGCPLTTSMRENPRHVSLVDLELAHRLLAQQYPPSSEFGGRAPRDDSLPLPSPTLPFTGRYTRWWVESGQSGYTHTQPPTPGDW